MVSTEAWQQGDSVVQVMESMSLWVYGLRVLLTSLSVAILRWRVLDQARSCPHLANRRLEMLLARSMYSGTDLRWFLLLILHLLVDMPAHQPRYPVGWNAGFSCFCRGCPCWNVSMCQVVVTQPSQQHSSFSETIPSIAGNHACLLYFPAAWAYHQTEQNATHVKI